ncbi:MAG: tRNA (adenosine(37)-N6)-dimethylallyltransferase MiaA [Treponema sp.]|nr:tRNA (adenosine(37)-N6)-dimethylallyltransferase MiaA [Treponema sp.]
MNQIPVIVIFAPTASGKTALTFELFSEEGSHFILNGKAEIISADSMAVYKNMDIGTAKPDSDFCRKIPHHLISICDIKKQFSVADFVTQADRICEEIYSRGKIPVVAGGTGFYIRSFLLGLPETPESDETIRRLLKERLELEGKEKLYSELKEKDPESASVIHPNDCYRILRALEVFYITGKPRSFYAKNKGFREKFRFLPIVLEPPRDILFKRIEERVETMFESGLVSEVEDLISKGALKEDPGMQGIGYKEFFLSNDENEIKKMIVHNSCKYAKKQYTYIRDLNIKNIISYTQSEKDIQKVKDLISDFIL